MGRKNNYVYIDNGFLEALLHDLSAYLRVQTQYLSMLEFDGKTSGEEIILPKVYFLAMKMTTSKGTEMIESARKMLDTPDKEYTFEEFSLESVINEVTGLTEIIRSYNKDITFVKEYKADCTAYSDRTRLYRVLLNVFNNSRTALDGVTNKTIKISTTDDDKFSYVRIQNNGPYITVKPISKVFKKYTTSAGKGHGIGLSSSRKYLYDTGGSITAENLKDEQGVAFTIKLPRTKEIYDRIMATRK
ncbi:HAMP domain-containing histidine kinase [Candidatus Woesearchaeota archaeon]|nr:HAMP domain-containing histidine kinase [Candidatus Woesearchaeota archaeon]